jgi:hypothetical protein
MSIPNSSSESLDWIISISQSESGSWRIPTYNERIRSVEHNQHYGVNHEHRIFHFTRVSQRSGFKQKKQASHRMELKHFSRASQE